MNIIWRYMCEMCDLNPNECQCEIAPSITTVTDLNPNEFPF